MMYFFPAPTWAFIVATVVLAGLIGCAFAVDWLARRAPLIDDYEDDFPYLEDDDAQRQQSSQAIRSPSQSGRQQSDRSQEGSSGNGSVTEDWQEIQKEKVT